jgi:hypothetical protein
MKIEIGNKVKSMAMICLGTVVLLTACQSSAQKEETAKQDVVDAKKDLKSIEQESADAKQKDADAAAWKVFKAETELKINANDQKIAELRAEKSKPGKMLDKMYEKRIENIATKNAEMRGRLISYDHAPTDWELFKTGFNHDMDELGESIKNIHLKEK